MLCLECSRAVQGSTDVVQGAIYTISRTIIISLFGDVVSSGSRINTLNFIPRDKQALVAQLVSAFGC